MYNIPGYANSSQLLDPQTNIQIGTQYLEYVYQQIRLPVLPLIFFFRFRRQARNPGVEATAIAFAQRKAHATFDKRGGFTVHHHGIAPARLL